MDSRETVDLVAAGYEWLCPECEHMNDEIQIPHHELKCQFCGASFKVGQSYNVYG